MDVIVESLATSGGFAPLMLFTVLVFCGVGLPLPEDIPLIVAGLLCAQGDMTWPVALGVSMSAILIGDTLLFLAGHRLGRAALRSGPIQRRFGARRIRRIRALYRLWGDRIVFFARFVMGIRAVAFFFAGALGVRYRRFLLLDSMAAVLSVPLWILLGWWLGGLFASDVQAVLDATEPYRAIVALVLFLVAIPFVIRFLRLLRLREPRSGETDQPEPIR